ncbi:MAG TPA: universal stress protein [Gaiellaceae bacterium]|nr:universal stress protein [Gaiellaceae bacterium]
MSAIVVGVDGSEQSKRALAWALEEARLRGAELRVVHTFLYPGQAWPGYVAPLDPGVLGMIRSEAEDLIESIVAEVAGAEPAVEIVRVVVEGAPSERLLEEAADADLLVLGSRGLGGFAGLLLGSVGQQCVHHARCPVVVIPPPRGSA